MDQGRTYADTILRLKHRDGDAWHPLVELEATHNVAERDVERGWLRSRIFRCNECDIEIVLEEERPNGN